MEAEKAQRKILNLVTDIWRIEVQAEEEKREMTSKEAAQVTGMQADIADLKQWLPPDQEALTVPKNKVWDSQGGSSGAHNVRIDLNPRTFRAMFYPDHVGRTEFHPPRILFEVVRVG